jgi:hypothetical protein
MGNASSLGIAVHFTSEFAQLCRSLRELGFDRHVNPQLALWATDKPPAMRALANIRSDQRLS